MNPDRNVKIVTRLQKALRDVTTLAKKMAAPGASPNDLAVFSDLIRQRTAAANALGRALSVEPTATATSAPLGNDNELPEAPVGDVAPEKQKLMVADAKIEETTSVAGGNAQGTAGSNFNDTLDMRNVKESKDVKLFRKYIRNLLEQLYQTNKSILFEEGSMDQFMPAQSGGDNLMSIEGSNSSPPEEEKSQGSTGIEYLKELFIQIKPAKQTKNNDFLLLFI
jgi:hypothetical protein